MAISLAFNNIYVSVKVPAEKSFKQNYNNVENALKAKKNDLIKCRGTLNLLNEQKAMTLEEYDNCLSVIPRNHFSNDSVVRGYFYTIEKDNRVSSWYYNSINGIFVDLYLDNIEDIFADDTLKLNKWCYLKSDNNAENKVGNLAYTIPIENNGRVIGYFGCVLNAYVMENYEFPKAERSSVTSFLIDTDGDILFRSDAKKLNNIYENPVYGETFKRILKTSRLSEISAIQLGKEAYIYENLSEGLIFIHKIDIFKRQINSNLAIIFISFVLVICFYVYHKTKDNSEIFERLFKKCVKVNYQDDTPLTQLKSRISFINVLCVFFGAIFILPFVLLMKHSFYSTVMLLFIGSIAGLHIVATCFFAENQKFKNIIVHILDISLVSFPGIFLVLLNTGESFTIVTVVLFASIVMAIGIIYWDQFKSIHIYYLIIVISFATQFIRVAVFHVGIDNDIIMYTVFIAFVGLIANFLYVLFRNYRNQNASAIESLENKVTASETRIIQSEKMAALGQLMAGISHEINTPIGAIKATADTFNLKLVEALKIMLCGSREFSEEDMEAFFKLMELSVTSVEKMLTTSEMRKGKMLICDYLSENGIEEDKAYSIAHMLSRVEICDVEVVKENFEIFQRENIEQLLKAVCDVFFLITGTNTIKLATNKVSKIMYAIRSYSNASMSTDKNGEFDIKEAIDNILTLYSSQFNSDITIDRIYADDVPKIIGNTEGLNQVFVNIIQNAFYALKDGGSLAIIVKADESTVYIDFADTGCGIAKENLQKIFEPLYTTKPLGEGSGLGLGICQNIIENHDGKISVKSELGKGSTFSIALPITQNLGSDKEENL